MLDSLSVTLPAYNEEASIADTVARVIEAAGDVPALEVIVVDDGSSDDTAGIVRGLAAHDSRIRLVQHTQNQGYGAAVHSGLSVGVETSKWVFFTDGDGQFDLTELPKLTEYALGADLVIGIRRPRRDPWMRRANAWGWNRLVTLLFGRTATDIDCAFKLMRSSALAPVLAATESRGATYSAELLIRARRAGCRVVEVPLSGHRPRWAGSQTGARISVIVRAAAELIRLRARL